MNKVNMGKRLVRCLEKILVIGHGGNGIHVLGNPVGCLQILGMD